MIPGRPALLRVEHPDVTVLNFDAHALCKLCIGSLSGCTTVLLTHPQAVKNLMRFLFRGPQRSVCKPPERACAVAITDVWWVTPNIGITRLALPEILLCEVVAMWVDDQP
jgi:hypothetical protein